MTANNPGVDVFYLLKYFADGIEGRQQLDNMAVTWQCLVLAEYSQSLGGLMQDYFPQSDRTTEEWDRVFECRF
jgi:hypothetical protein